MHIDPDQIQLSPDQQAFIAREAERLGRPWVELLRQFVPATPREGDGEETAYEAADRLGLIGGVRSGLGDLASNPEHLEGFGRD